MSENLVRHEEDRGVHHLVMCHGPNALNRPLMEALRDALQQLVSDGAPAVLLRSNHHTLFCPGWDLKLLAAAEREEVGVFLSSFNRLILDLFSYPGPTAAAIGGHAVAGGCSMVLACDLRVMVEGRPRIGISELNLGVPVPGACVRMLRARLSSPALDDLLFRGDGCTAERARSLGIVHQAVDGDALVATTGRELGKLASRPRRAFVESKRFLYGDVWSAIGETRAEEDAAFLDCWFETETQKRIGGMAQRLRR